MKDYPHILNCAGQSFRAVSGAHVFDKLDGNNIRAEYSHKQNWHKFGTRTQRMDHTDKVLGGAIAVFMAQQSEALTKMARDERWERVTVFGSTTGRRHSSASISLTRRIRKSTPCSTSAPTRKMSSSGRSSS